mgnify:CR=1 FL=1
MREFAIAYSDQDGRDFGNNVPWIENNYNSKEECMEWVDKLTSNGFQRVTPFTYEQDEVLAEEIDWSFVEKHRI